MPPEGHHASLFIGTQEKTSVSNYFSILLVDFQARTGAQTSNYFSSLFADYQPRELRPLNIYLSFQRLSTLGVQT